MNFIIVSCLLAFGLLAWFAKGQIEKHMAISALGVFVVCFLANASILLPSSSVLIVVEYSMIINPFLVAACGALGSSLGEMTGFFVGRYGRKAVPGKLMKWVKSKMKNQKYLIVLLFSILPLPVFDIVGMLSGAMKMNPLKFFGICFAGKFIKMLCYVWLAYELLPFLR